MTYPSFRSCERLVLTEVLAFFHESDEGEFLTPEQIQEICGLKISRIMLFKVLDSLVDQQRMERTNPDKKSPDVVVYTLTRKGIEAAERVASTSDAPASAIASIPASDRVVSLDDNSAGMAVDAIEAAENAIRSSNTVSPEERPWLQSHLNAGKTLLKAKQITSSAIRSLLIQPLYAAWKAVGEDVGKEVIQKAILLIKQLAGWS